MSDLNATRSAPTPLGDRIALAISGLRAALRRRATHRRTLRELYALTSRDLKDLGLRRADIARTAREAAYGH